MRHGSGVCLRAMFVLAASVLAFASRASAQPLPVVLEMTGGGDNRWESIQLDLGGLHVTQQVPLAIGVVPCRQSSPPGSGCLDDGSLHSTFQLWTSNHPTVIEVGQQGRDNSEALGTLTAVQQRALIEEGMNALLGWGLGNDEPLFFTPARGSSNPDTTAIVADLGFHTFSQATGGCPTGGTGLDKVCTSVPLCERTPLGARVTGPDCVLRSFSDLATEIETRAADGVVFVTFSPQDLSISTANQAIDPAKRTAYETLIAAFADAEANGRFDVRTFDTHYRLTRGLPLPTPEATPRPTPTPKTPTNLPVVFSEDDPEDGTWESATVRVHDLFISEGVPRTQETVACGAPSPIDGSQCINTTFHEIYAGWIAAHPDLIEIGHHGLTHDEVLTSMTREQQKDFISRGLAEMSTWGLPGGRPFTFAAPFSAINADTVSVLEELGYHVYVKNAGSCAQSTVMDPFCDSVSLCELSPSGSRVSGPDCVLKAPEALIHEINARGGEGRMFINFHVQDFYLPDLVTLDESKFDALAAILQAFRDEEIAGHYDLMTMETFYRQKRGLPTPVPGATVTPTPPGPSATPTSPIATPTNPVATPTSPIATPTNPIATPTGAIPTPTKTTAPSTPTPPASSSTPTRTPRWGGGGGVPTSTPGTVPTSTPGIGQTPQPTPTISSATPTRTPRVRRTRGPRIRRPTRTPSTVATPTPPTGTTPGASTPTPASTRTPRWGGGIL